MTGDRGTGLTSTEWRLLGPLATDLHARHPQLWSDLRFQTQYGPESHSWPYFPAALEFQSVARESVYALTRAQREALVLEWRSRTRLISLTPVEAILDRYGMIVLDILIRRARAAGRRTSFD